MLSNAKTKLAETSSLAGPTTLGDLALKQTRSNCLTCIAHSTEVLSITMKRGTGTSYAHTYIFKIITYALVQWSTTSLRRIQGQILNGKQGALTLRSRREE